MAYEQTAYNRFGNIFAQPISSYRDMADPERQDVLVTTAQEVFGLLVQKALEVPEVTLWQEPDGPQHLYIEGGPGKVAATGYSPDDLGRPQKVVTAYTAWEAVSGRYGVVHNEYETDKQQALLRFSTSLILLKKVVPFGELCNIPSEENVRTRYEVIRRDGAMETVRKPKSNAASLHRITRLPHEPLDMYHLLNYRLCRPIEAMAFYGGLDG